MDDDRGILVLPSALKRPGIEEADIEHALAFAVRSFDADDWVMTIGPGRDGGLLEIGHRARWGFRSVVFHAMAARNHFLLHDEGR